jgi:hypothetical protein
MSEPRETRKRYVQRLPANGTKEDLELQRRIARHMGVSMAGVVRQLLREKARELGLTERD